MRTTLKQQLAEATDKINALHKELLAVKQGLATLRTNEPEMRRQAYGIYARRAAFNYVVQPTGQQNRAGIIGTTSFSNEMSFGGGAAFPHTLVLCECIIRPRLVIGSKHCAGQGAAGLLTAHDGLASLDPWLQHGQIILDNR